MSVCRGEEKPQRAVGGANVRGRNNYLDGGGKADNEGRRKGKHSKCERVRSQAVEEGTLAGVGKKARKSQGTKKDRDTSHEPNGFHSTGG